MNLCQRSCLSIAACAAMLLAGCSTGPKPVLPTVALPERWRAETTALAGGVPSEWWKVFDDERIDRLVRRVLESNGNLLIATQRLRQARLAVDMAAIGMDPKVTGGGGATWGTDLSGSHGRRSHGGNVDGSLTYNFDLGGGLAGARDAASWMAVESEANRERAIHLAVQESLIHYWQIGLLSERSALARERLSNAEKTLVLVQARYEAGSKSRIDLADAREVVAAGQAAILRLNKELLMHGNALAVLLGDPPESAMEMPGRLSTQNLAPIPAGVPADAIARRPDVHMAEAQLRTALADVEIARSALYPSLTLTTNAGTSSDSLKRFLTNPVATVGLSVALPFIEWSKTQLEIKRSSIQFEKVVTQFRDAVHGALKEVENELTTSAELEREEEQLNDRLRSALISEDVEKARYMTGEIDLQPWLQRQQAVREVREELLQNHFDRLTNRVALIVALGGGDGFGLAPIATRPSIADENLTSARRM